MEGIQPLPEKLESIAKMPAPRTPKEVKQFLGTSMATTEKFVPRFADISQSSDTPYQKGRGIQMDSRV